MSVMGIIFSGVFGLMVGSFLYVLMDRLPAGKSLIYPPSHCDSCQRRLSPIDLIPVFSFLLWHGRCRYCQAKIPRRVIWVEAGVAIWFAFTFQHYGLTADFARISFYGCLFLVIGVIDLEHRLILDKMVYPSLLVAMALNAIFSRPEFVNGLIGSIVGLVLLLAIFFVSRGGMGMGDVKMAALIGAATGFPQVFVALLLGIILGGVVAVFLVLLRIRGRKEYIPFGPFLSLATIVALVWGTDILGWYLRMFQ